MIPWLLIAGAVIYAAIVLTCLVLAARITAAGAAHLPDEDGGER